MKYLIGLDIGTSSIKGVLMTTEGEVVKTARGGFTYTVVDGGGIEIGANDFASVCLAAIKELADSADGEICGVCTASASGNLLVLDKNNQPATPIYNWQDKRTTTEATDVLGDVDTDAFYRQNGWPFLPHSFPLSLLCYLKVHQPEVLENCGKVCMSTEYLYYLLTGKWGISTSVGTTFYLLDQQTGEYVQERLDTLGISEDKLPPVMAASSVLGGVLPEMEELCGLPAGTPIVLGTFDHPSAARGVGVLNEGEVLLSCGTSWVCFVPVNDRNKAADAGVLIDPFLSPQGGPWGTMVSVASVSEQLQRYVHRYIDNSDKAYSVLSSLAAKSTPGAGGLTLLPNEEPDDKKVEGFSKEDIARAIMEGTVYLLQDKLNSIRKMGIELTAAVMVGGPSVDPMWHKLIADICGISVRVLHGAHAGSVGAAMMAGIGVGLFKDEVEANNVFNK